MPEQLITLQEHVILQRGIPCRLPQDMIRYGDRLIGYVGTQRDAVVCLIVHGLPDSIKNQIKLVVADRDQKLYGDAKVDAYKNRRISQPPKADDGISG